MTIENDREHQLQEALYALALMANQYLGPDLLDNQCMSAGENAFAVLERHGLLTSCDNRNGEWTDSGRALLG